MLQSSTYCCGKSEEHVKKTLAMERAPISMVDVGNGQFTERKHLYNSIN
jgi:hypothetical protein